MSSFFPHSFHFLFASFPLSLLFISSSSLLPFFFSFPVFPFLSSLPLPFLTQVCSSIIFFISTNMYPFWPPPQKKRCLLGKPDRSLDDVGVAEKLICWSWFFCFVDPFFKEARFRWDHHTSKAPNQRKRCWLVQPQVGWSPCHWVCNGKGSAVSKYQWIYLTIITLVIGVTSQLMGFTYGF